MLQKAKSLTELPVELAWPKYCGFLDLSTNAFLEIQEQNLRYWLSSLVRSGVGMHFLNGSKPRSVREYRQIMPLTRFQDYAPFLQPDAAPALPEPPVFWAKAIRRNSEFTWIPYTQAAFKQLLESTTALLFLASSTGREALRLSEGDRVLFNIAPKPFLTGFLAEGLESQLNLSPVFSPEENQQIEFEAKTSLGFTRALHSGVDVVAALTSVLLKMGETFESRTARQKWSKEFLHPAVALRLLRALVISKLQGRAILPRDLWPVKSLICWGIDTALYRQQLKHYWGCEPYEIIANTEAGILAVQSWSRQGMTFLPTSNFLEFIPERDALETAGDDNAIPPTLLLSQLEAGGRYEVVITSCNGMPFLRYRLGLLIEVIAPSDEANGIALPQVGYAGRIDDIIDIAGFTRIDSRTLEGAMASVSVPIEDWVARKEIENGGPILRLYLEPKNGYPSDFPTLLHRSLVERDPFYRDLDLMLDIRPIRVTTLAKGTFDRYYKDHPIPGIGQNRGHMARVNPTDDEIRGLLCLGKESAL